MRWLRWIRGRQLGDDDKGYAKMLLFLFGIPKLFGLDIYLIKFIPNYYLPTHKDPVTWAKPETQKAFRESFGYGKN